MTKKIKKGKKIVELLKGSMEYTLRVLKDAFRKQFPYQENGVTYFIDDSFSDYVLLSSYANESPLGVSEFYKVMYEREGENFTFAAFDEWEIVELTSQPKTKVIITEDLKKGGKRFEEIVAPDQVQLLEKKDESDGTRRIRINGLMEADTVNGNGRLYSESVIGAMVADWQPYLRESRGQGRLMILTGEVEHPSSKRKKSPEFLETVVRWDTLDWDGKCLNIEGDLILTSKGRDVEILMEAGVNPGGSIRGIGESKMKKVGKEKVEIVQWVSLNAADLVGDPSFVNSAALQESNNPMEDEMTIEELLALLKANPDAFDGITEAQIKKMGEAQLASLEESLRKTLNLDGDADIGKTLKENAEKAARFDVMQQEKAVADAIQEATKDLPFGEALNMQFTEALMAAAPDTPEGVKSLVEAKREEYAKLASGGLLKGMGFNDKTKTFEVIGSVFEKQTGVPEFALPSHKLIESISRGEMREMRDLSKPVTRAEHLTQQILERFDAVYQHHLIREANEFAEAQQTSDLNLPYSVSRAIIAEAYPNLVAANIFDVGTIETSPTRLYYEAHTGESGYTATITDEVVTMGAEETWYALAHGRVTPGTVVVTSNPAGTTYTENTDFVIDYAAGRILALTAGDIDANDVLVDYGYTAIREGEMQPIQRAKTSLTYMVVTAAADRLADQLSREAVVFSRSQLGYDTVTRTMASLIRQTQRKIDQGMLYMALAAVKKIASNTGGTWTTGNDQTDYDDLARLIGETKVIVANRPYTPTFVLMSITNAEDLSNWAGFKRDGFPNAILNAAGYAGNVKGLAVWASSEFPDDTIIVGNRELVMYRVYQPMIVKGPFPTYDVSGSTSKLVAADQYYTEEFNVTESPVEEKGAFLTVAAGS